MWIPAGIMTVGDSSLNDPRLFPSGLQGNNPGTVERHDYDDDDNYYFWLFSLLLSPSLPLWLLWSEHRTIACGPCGKKGACIL